jgi:hypothetical protein
VKRVEVRFKNGQDVLLAYWGFLSDGGLVIPDREEFAEGQPVRLQVKVASLASDYELGGRIVRRHAADRQAIVAFDPGEPHDMLLTAALAETDDVPARRYQRFSVSLPAELSASEGAAGGHLIDVSAGGCCVRLDAPSNGALAIGAPVSVSTQEFSASGTVVWSRGLDRGVSFDAAGVWAAQQFLDRL